MGRTTTSTATTFITIQPAQGTEVGSYNPHQPLPYPWHIDLDGAVLRQDFWEGQPARLAGFQREADVQRVEILDVQWLEDLDTLDRVVGMYPVFIDKDGGMWNSTHPVESVTVYRAPEAGA